VSSAESGSPVVDERLELDVVGGSIRFCTNHGRLM
jgi:hypothetical protein